MRIKINNYKINREKANYYNINLIWNEKDNVKYGDFPEQSQSFPFFAWSSHCWK